MEWALLLSTFRGALEVVSGFQSFFSKLHVDGKISDEQYAEVLEAEVAGRARRDARYAAAEARLRTDGDEA